MARYKCNYGLTNGWQRIDDVQQILWDEDECSISRFRRARLDRGSSLRTKSASSFATRLQLTQLWLDDCVTFRKRLTTKQFESCRFEIWGSLKIEDLLKPIFHREGLRSLLRQRQIMRSHVTSFLWANSKLKRFYKEFPLPAMIFTSPICMWKTN